MQNVSISTTIFGPKGKSTTTLALALRALAEAGFREVELSRKHTSLTAHAATIRALGLRVWAVHGTLGFGCVAADEVARRQVVAMEIRRLHDTAPFAPCPYVVHYLNRHHDPAVGERFRRSIDELVPVATELGLTLAVETVPDKPSNERFPDSREIAQFVRSFALPQVSLCFDLNHSNIREDLPQAIANCAGVISNIHVSDNHGTEEEHLPPGAGTIDFATALPALAAAGYAGALNLECHLPDNPTLNELVQLRQWAEAAVATMRCRPKTV